MTYIQSKDNDLNLIIQSNHILQSEMRDTTIQPSAQSDQSNQLPKPLTHSAEAHFVPFNLSLLPRLGFQYDRQSVQGVSNGMDPAGCRLLLGLSRGLMSGEQKYAVRQRVSDPGYSALSEEKTSVQCRFLNNFFLCLTPFLLFLPYHLHSFLLSALSLSLCIIQMFEVSKISKIIKFINL